MTKYPKMDFWPTDYLADTMELSCLQRGAYSQLLFKLWIAKENKLPFERAILSRVCGLSYKQWDAVWEKIGRYFVVKEGLLFHQRILDGVKTIEDKRRQCSDAGRASALKRLYRDSTPVEISFNENSTSIPSPNSNDDDKARKDQIEALIAYTCSELRLNPSENTEHLVWFRALDALLSDGFTEAQIKTGVEIARQKGVPKMNYIVACVRSPPPNRPRTEAPQRLTDDELREKLFGGKE